MKANFLFIFLATLLLPILNVAGYENPGNDYVLTVADINKLKIVALNGSVEAADRLVKYYDFYKHDHLETMRWLTIAAENGSHFGCSGLILFMREDQNPELQERAKFWEMQDAAGKCSALSDHAGK